MAKSKIEWTDEVWNPVTGCTKVSAGCKNCYAERIAKRFWGLRKFTDVQCHADRLDIPGKWSKQRRVFVNSMSDLFHKDVHDYFIREVFWTMDRTRLHTYQILTKRPIRMYEFLSENNPVLPNVWLGVSVEDQETADERIPWLMRTPAALRFVSYEPALGPVDFGEYLGRSPLSDTSSPRIDWIIAGDESGPGKRPAELDWFRLVRDQCAEAEVPFFFKQFGSAKMPKLDGVVYDQMPSYSLERAENERD